MSVLTEAKIRHYFKELAIVENGIFELARGERLTPAARSFLNDHHVKIVDSNLTREKSSQPKEGLAPKPIKSLEDSAVYPLLFRLTRLYPYFLKAQGALHRAFLSDKCSQMGLLLSVLEQLVGQHLLDDVSNYSESLLTNTELQGLRISHQLDQQAVLLDYQEPAWRLATYESYIELGLLRREFELVSDFERDAFSLKVCQLLKSLEVLVWLVASK